MDCIGSYHILCNLAMTICECIPRIVANNCMAYFALVTAKRATCARHNLLSCLVDFLSQAASHKADLTKEVLCGYIRMHIFNCRLILY